VFYGAASGELPGLPAGSLLPLRTVTAFGLLAWRAARPAPAARPWPPTVPGPPADGFFRALRGDP